MTAILRNVGKYSPVDTAQYPRDFCLPHNINFLVRTQKFWSWLFCSLRKRGGPKLMRKLILMNWRTYIKTCRNIAYCLPDNVFSQGRGNISYVEIPWWITPCPFLEGFWKEFTFQSNEHYWTIFLLCPYFLIPEEEFCDNTVRIKLFSLFRHAFHSSHHDMRVMVNVSFICA